MMIGRFRRLLEAHGADPARWPPELRPAAERLMAASAKARSLLAEAQALDKALRSVAMMEAPDDEGLAERIIARATALPQERSLPLKTAEEPFRLSLRWLLPQAAGLAAAGIVGFVVGFSGLLPGNGDGTVDLSDFAAGLEFEEDPL